MNTFTYNVTELVGNDENSSAAASNLVAQVYRTLNPPSWFQAGGTATIRAYFNPVQRRWYLSIYSAIAQADMQNFLNTLKS
jgi:hypothetical protein